MLLDGSLAEVPLAQVAPGDRLLVRRGDVVPVDGTIMDGVGILDRSALTGESVPVRQGAGEPVMSGVTNVGDAFYMLATRRAAESTYAGIVRLVEEARSSKAPMARLADRFAIVFLVITVVVGRRRLAVDGRPDPRAGRAGRRDARVP